MTSIDKATLSVVIVSYQSSPELEACLTSLRIAVAEAHLALELIVVDNASTDDSVSIVRAIAPYAEIISNETNVGFARAVNAGLERTRGELILLLNPDTIVNGRAVARCVQRLDEPALGLTAPILRNEDGSRQQSWHEFPTHWHAFVDAVAPLALFRILRRRVSPPPGGPEWIIGAFMMSRQDVVAAVGPLDERSFMYGEDMEWCFRIRRAGFRIELQRDVEITHLGGRSAERSYGPMERDLAAERVTLDWMGGSRAYAALRWIGAVQQGFAASLIAALVPASRARLRRPLARRMAARQVYGSVFRRRRPGRSADGPTGHPGLQS